MEFPLNAEVHCTDGRAGRSTYIIVDPTTEKVTHVVVRERQPSRVERLVPVKLVVNTAAELILLHCSLEQFSKLELFNQTHFIHGDLPHHATDPALTLLWPHATPAKRTVGDRVRAIPPGELAVRRGASVRATDGRIGRVDQFLVDPQSGNITHLCLREGHLWEGKQVCIPVSAIDRIREKVVHLKIDKEAVAALPSLDIESRA
jgi:sporulation protein YlmC with PRC-barrel domain